VSAHREGALNLTMASRRVVPYTKPLGDGVQEPDFHTPQGIGRFVKTVMQLRLYDVKPSYGGS
jgi:hypothetical protein